jgi:phenylacetate-CoA ligase
LGRSSGTEVLHADHRRPAAPGSRWRRAAIAALLRVSGSEVPGCLRLFRQLESATPAVVAEYQRRQLLRLLRHCQSRVPYYRQLFEACGLDLADDFTADRLQRLPLLTKDALREHGQALRSDDLAQRGAFENASGGSTGKPVVFVQDRAYHARSVVAAKLVYNELLGKRAGDPEINLWGSERDVERGSLGIRQRAMNFVYNRRFQNCFTVDDARLARFVEEINRFRPVSMWAYVQSLELLAKFIRREGLEVHSPKLILSTAGTLEEGVRRLVQDVFRCPVYNQYGCREAGAIAFEMPDQDGMRGLPYLNYVEVVDGKVVVTNLANYSMPLVRYRLDDTAEPWTGEQDPRFGCRHKILRTVSGRTHSHFRTANGALVHGGFLAHPFWTMDWVRQFQVVQERLDAVTCRIVPAGKPEGADLERIRRRIRRAMGADCAIEFAFPDRIPPPPSGKHQYTISHLA